jgi:hypothetical protein
MARLLHRGGRHSWDEISVLYERSEIPDHEGSIVAWNRQILADLDSPGAVEWHAERLRERRCRNPGCPENGSGGNHFIAKRNALGGDLGHLLAG